MPYPKTKEGKKKLARAYRFCNAQIKKGRMKKSKKESCVYKIYKKSY